MEKCLTKVISTLYKETQEITKKKDLSLKDLDNLQFLIRLMNLCQSRIDLDKDEFGTIGGGRNV